jgi:hypothetical protein
MIKLKISSKKNKNKEKPFDVKYARISLGAAWQVRRNFE